MTKQANRQRRHRREKRREQRTRINDRIREWLDQTPPLPLELRLERASGAYQRAFIAMLAQDIAVLEAPQ